MFELKQKEPNRWLVVLGGAIIMLCVGVLHAWGVFVIPVINHFGWQKDVVALVQSVMFSMFTFGMFIGGTLLNKLGAKKTILLGTTLFAGGIFITGFATDPAFYYIFYGVIAGIGVGISNMAAIFVCMQWFPDMRGTVTGIVVGCFGFSLVILAPGITYTMASIGVPTTFLVLGALFGVIMVITTMLLMRTPPTGWSPKNFKKKGGNQDLIKQYTVTEAKSTRSFWGLVLACSMFVAIYTSVIPYIVVYSTTVKGLDMTTATLAVSLVGVMSATGRLTFSTLQDKLGSRNMFVLAMGISILAVLILPYTDGLLVVACFALIALGFGGATPIFPVASANAFGIKNAGAIYGIISLAMIPTLLAWPIASVAVRNATGGSWEASFMFIAIGCVLAAIGMLFVNKKGTIIEQPKQTMTPDLRTESSK